MARQYVHLCENGEEAYRAGRRKDRNPVVLHIRARMEEVFDAIKCGGLARIKW